MKKDIKISEKHIKNYNRGNSNSEDWRPDLL